MLFKWLPKILGTGFGVLVVLGCCIPGLFLIYVALNPDFRNVHLWFGYFMIFVGVPGMLGLIIYKKIQARRKKS